MLSTTMQLTVPVLAPEAAPALGLSPKNIGYYTSILYLFAMTTALMSGGYIRRYGPLRVSQFCLFAGAAGLALFGSGFLPLVVLSAVALGIGYGPVTPASSDILAERTPLGMAPFVFSFKQTGVPLGGALAGAAVPYFVAKFGWQGAAVSVGVIALLLALAVQVFRREYDANATGAAVAGERPEFFGPLKFVMADPQLRPLAFATFTFAAMQLTFGSFIVTYLTTEIGYSLAAAGAALSVAQISGAVARIVWGSFTDKWVSARRMLTILALVMGGAAMLTAAMTADWPRLGVLVLLAVFGASAVGWTGIYLAEVARLAPEGQAARATGGTLFFTFGGCTLGPPLFSFLANFTDSFGTPFILFGLFTTAAGLSLLFGGRKRRAIEAGS